MTNHLRTSWKCYLLLLLAALAGLSLILWLTADASFGQDKARLDALWHLAAGFAYFLQDNLPRISTDAGTWGPGLFAFGLALAVLHLFFRNWATKRNRPWSAGSTLCAGLVLPLLFAISFLVPGVLLQVKLLAEVKWFGVRWSESFSVRTQLGRLRFDLLSVEETYGRFPDSLEELVDWHRLSRPSQLWMRGTGEVPAEPPIYLGAGLTSKSEASLPLLISPCYLRNNAKMRQVLTVGGQEHEIRDEEVDAWIDKTMMAGKR
jgi:hypothetical protein